MSGKKKAEELQEEEVKAASEEAEETPVEENGEQETEEEKSVEILLEEALAENADLRDKMLRAVADFDNTKKRMERERQTLMKYAGENIFKEILPALDNLERAIDQGVVEGADAEKNLTALLEGVQLTQKSLVASLEKFEVKPIQSIGEPFDPQKQEALTMEPSDSVPANHVTAEYEKGYYYKDRLLRAAKVIVSSGKTE